MRTLLRWLACVSVACAAFGEARAEAAVSAVTVNTGAITRVAADGTTLYECPGRGASTTGCIVESKYQGVGHRDCLDDTELVFPVTVTGLPDPTVTMEVWAGTGDCTAAGATHNNSTATCWPVAPNPTAQAVMSIHVRVADLVSQLGVSPPPQTYGTATETADVACNNSAASGTSTTTTDDAGNTTTTVGESTVNVFFMFYPTGSSTPSISSAAYPVKVKLVGPAACTNVTSGTGDGALVVTWSPPAGDTSVQGFNLYAAPSGTGGGEGGTVTVCPDASQGTQLFDDAGNPVFDDAGNPVYVDDAGNPVSADAGCYTQTVPPGSNTCSNGTGTIDVSGMTCPGGDANGGICTQVNGATNAKGTITGLTNGVSYDVAVAAFDQFGNVGTISGAVCSTPAAIDDFWKIYNQDGGSAYCALEAVGSRGGGVAAALMSVVGMVFLRRRRRARRR
jgi:hypothetical protein